jgi:hypothetical protein
VILFFYHREGLVAEDGDRTGQKRMGKVKLGQIKFIQIRLGQVLTVELRHQLFLFLLRDRDCAKVVPTKSNTNF